jgi:hypothetical protein
MEREKGQISIWFFVGCLLLVYGALILGRGVYEFFSPPAVHVKLAELHAGIWWGGLLVVLGVVYTVHFLPKRNK